MLQSLIQRKSQQVLEHPLRLPEPEVHKANIKQIMIVVYMMQNLSYEASKYNSVWCCCTNSISRRESTNSWTNFAMPLTLSSIGFSGMIKFCSYQSKAIKVLYNTVITCCGLPEYRLLYTLKSLTPKYVDGYMVITCRSNAEISTIKYR